MYMYHIHEIKSHAYLHIWKISNQHICVKQKSISIFQYICLNFFVPKMFAYADIIRTYRHLRVKAVNCAYASALSAYTKSTWKLYTFRWPDSDLPALHWLIVTSLYDLPGVHWRTLVQWPPGSRTLWPAHSSSSSLSCRHADSQAGQTWHVIGGLVQYS